jgi:hypothetical protein
MNVAASERASGREERLKCCRVEAGMVVDLYCIHNTFCGIIEKEEEEDSMY